MTDTEIYTQLNEIFRDVFDDESIVVDAKTTSDDVDGWDSLANINIIISVENAFGIKFNMSEITGFKCLGDMVDAIRNSIQ